MLEEGWYLMSPSDVELELARLRDPSATRSSNAEALEVADALAYRDAGNLPDEQGRTLRLVLRATGAGSIEARRLEFEPDFHDAPTWRRAGSKPVNIIPLGDQGPPPEGAWWDDPAVRELEEEWKEHGTIAGLKVPGEFRSFVHKTVLSLQAAGKDLTPDSVADSIARWVPPGDANRIRNALRDANP